MKRIFDNAKPLLEKAIEVDNNYTEAKELLTVINKQIIN